MSGDLNQLADNLSRYNVPDENDDEEWDKIDVRVASRKNTRLVRSALEQALIDREKFLSNGATAQSSDSKLAKMIHILSSKKRGAIVKGFKLIDGVLYRAIYCYELIAQRFVICVGSLKLRLRLLELAHLRGHCGIYQMFLVLSRRVYWPNMYRSIVEYVETCERFQRGHADRYNQRNQPQSTEISSSPFVQGDSTLMGVRLSQTQEESDK